MAKATVNFTGINGLALGIALLCLVVARIFSAGENNDEELRTSVERLLMSEFYPSQLEQMKSALQIKNPEQNQQAIEHVLANQLEILSIKTSYPFLDFSSPRKIIVYVQYDLGDGEGPQEQYYRYKYGALGNSWQYEYESNKVSYYLNFL